MILKSVHVTCSLMILHAEPAGGGSCMPHGRLASKLTNMFPYTTIQQKYVMYLTVFCRTFQALVQLLGVTGATRGYM